MLNTGVLLLQVKLEAVPIKEEPDDWTQNNSGEGTQMLPFLEPGLDQMTSTSAVPAEVNCSGELNQNTHNQSLTHSTSSSTLSGASGYQSVSLANLTFQ